jgi:hypothetical protein
LCELGLVEGQSYAVESLSADCNAARLAELAAELVARKVDVIAATKHERRQALLNVICGPGGTA